MKKVIIFTTTSLIAMALASAVTACSPQSASTSNDIATNTESTYTWSINSDCTSCHVDASQDGTACSAHLATGKVTCTDCHTADAITPVHENLTNAADAASTAATLTQLSQTTVNASICESCHDINEVAATTTNSTVLTDADGTVVNPHALPTTGPHTTDITCTDCHKQHSTTTLDKSAQRECQSCHHTNVYQCGTCHSV